MRTMNMGFDRAPGRAVRVGAIGLALFGLVACASGPASAPPCEVAGADTGAADTGGGEGARDVRPDLPDVVRPGDAPTGDALLGDVAAVGAFGDRCVDNAACVSGWCVAFEGGYVCSSTCGEERCPAGWTCVRVENTAPDYQSVCRPLADRLCVACTDDEQCAGGLCRTLDDGSRRCTRACAVDLPCPDGFVCEATGSEASSELVSDQCLPVSGVCDCGPGDAGRERPCFVENAAGRCWGSESCDPGAGWVGCDAPDPAPEECNGRDEDCDGRADEDAPLPSTPCEVANEWGACPGAWSCRGVEGFACVAESPAEERCDYRDNDCDGATDEAFRNTPDGPYDRVSDCGACGYSCVDALPFVAAAECVVDGSVARCEILACDPGYRKPEGMSVCVPSGAASDCTPCSEDRHCESLPGVCVEIDGARHCARTCAADADCPGSYACDDGACRPRSGSCTCVEGQEGATRPCQRANAYGVCGGTQTCRGVAGWEVCTAAEALAETCNGADDDCDGEADEAGALGCTARHRDADRDGAGADDDLRCVCAPTSPYDAVSGGDCDDAAPLVGPEAAERCNARDDDCDGAIDEADADGCRTFYRDADGDLYGRSEGGRCLCAPAFPYTAEEAGDCDDGDARRSPASEEACGGADEDCDGATDEAGALDCAPHYPDTDGDGFGDDARGACLCGPTLEYPVTVGGDCDDGSGSVSPRADEWCNGRDDDCNGTTDDTGAVGCTPRYRDQDGDGYGASFSAECRCSAAPPFSATRGGDCDDNDPTWVPGADEPCVADADCCLPGAVCRFERCLGGAAPCDRDDDCANDTYCLAGECLPWGLGPAGTSDDRCVRPAVPGLFRPTLQCEWSGPPVGDPYPDHVNVLSTAMVADFDFDADPDTIRPSVVFTSYNYTDGGDEASDGAGAKPAQYFGVVRVLDGGTCVPIATIDAAKVVGSNPLAVGDVDGDGRPEIAAHAVGGGLVVFRYDPATRAFGVLWESHTAAGVPHRPYAAINRWGGPSITDLDGDGRPELVMATYVYDAEGVLRADNLGLARYRNGHNPVLADVDGDGAVELVQGSGIWGYSGGTWVREAYSSPSADGFVALGDFGTYSVAGLAEPLPEVVVVSSGQARVQDLSGRTIFGPYTLPYFPPATDPGDGGSPTVGDFDGDGRPEFAQAGRGAYVIYDLDCAVDPLPAGCAAPGVLWALPAQDISSSMTGSSIFDFEGDGYAEAVYADECFTRVYRGVDGEVLFSQWRSSCTWYENPVVADTDGDGYSEIVMGSNSNCGKGAACPALDPYFRGLRCAGADECPSGACVAGFCRCEADADCGGTDFVCADPVANTPGAGRVCRAGHPRINYGGLRVYRDALDNWVSSRVIWNQQAYFVTNVEEDGTIPVGGEWATNWTTPGLNNFRQNVQGTLAPAFAPDLTVRVLPLEDCDAAGALRMRVAVCNRGATAPPGPVSVAYYDGDPQGGSPVCVRTTSGAPLPGACEEVECAWTVPGPDVPHDLYVVADYGAGSRECWEGNNRALVRGVTCTNLP